MPRASAPAAGAREAGGFLAARAVGSAGSDRTRLEEAKRVAREFPRGYPRGTVKEAVFLVSVNFLARPHKRSEILSALDETVERMRHAPGCGHCRLLVDTEDLNAFMLTSEWLSLDSVNSFFDSRDFQILKGIRILLREEPVVVLDEVQSRVSRLIHVR
jgi:quinol monooxygenase YgiN